MTPADLLPQVYDELRKLAGVKLAAEKPGQTLDATALVHEVFLKLGGQRSFASKSDYLKAAAQAMRRILVDRAAPAMQPSGAAAVSASISNHTTWLLCRRTTMSKRWTRRYRNWQLSTRKSSNSFNSGILAG